MDSVVILHSRTKEKKSPKLSLLRDVSCNFDEHTIKAKPKTTDAFPPKIFIYPEELS